MLKSFKLKIYANKGKLRKLDSLIDFWKNHVNKKIDLFWDFDEVKGSFPPKEYKRGSRFINDSSTKAWRIVKGVKNRTKKLCLDLQELDFYSKHGKELREKINNIYKKPIFKGEEVDLNEATIKFSPHKNHFDFWVRISNLIKGKRLRIPCKKFERFNRFLKKGKLKKSAKLLRRDNGYFLEVYIEIPEKESNNKEKIGLDIGMNNPVASSDGKFYGKELKELRIRTKWRKYKNKTSPYKQGLNRIVKEVIRDNPCKDFVVEKLLFKGKKGRTKRFRRRNNNWSYNFFLNKLEEHGKTEGFEVIRVPAYYTSLKCPSCGQISKLNRNGDIFCCINCSYKNHADVVGAINVLERVGKEVSSLRKTLNERHENVFL